MVASKIVIFAPICAVVFTGGVVIALILSYNDQSRNLEKETQRLEKSLYRLEESIRVWKSKPLSNQAKDNIVRLVDRELEKCSSVGPLSINLKVIKSLQQGDNRTMEKYLKVRKPMAHLTADSKLYEKKHEKEQTITYWEDNESGTTYVCNGVKLDTNHLIIQQTGPYYVYSQLKYRYKPSKSGHLHRHVTYLRNGKKTFNILENSYLLGEGSGIHGEKTSYQSRYIKLYKGERLFVTSQVGPHTEHMKDLDSDTFFGLFLLS